VLMGAQNAQSVYFTIYWQWSSGSCHQQKIVPGSH
jgi:hypothetical protein